jgi:pyruvate ferredoxin oxidoreductase gamma subunit
LKNIILKLLSRLILQLESFGGLILAKITEVRFHGRGGQGVVTASRILANAALSEGKWIQAFPEFGPERAGAPIKGYTRISDEKFTIKSAVYTPDVVAVIDPTLVKLVPVTESSSNRRS